jgi:hypothetical protein
MEREEALPPRESAGEPAAAAIDIDRLADQVPQLAVRRNLRIVPATPLSSAGSGQLVLLGSSDLSAEEFCDLAATAGARLLYLQAEFFDAGADLGLDASGQIGDHPGPAGGRRAELYRDAQRCDGRISHLELAFAAGCVLHCWAIVADWYENLVDRAEELFPAWPRFPD